MARATAGRRGIGALLATYIGYGAFWGVWVVVFADYLRHHDLSPGRMSIGFTALSVSAILVMTFVAPRLEALSRGAALALALAIQALGAALVAVMPTSWLIPVFIVLGMGTGLVDVFVNAAGHEIEVRARASVLQWVHAAYGVGGVIGALGAGIALTLGSPFGPVILAAAAGHVVSAMWVLSSPALRTGPGIRTAGRFSLGAFVRAPFLLVPGLVVLFAFFVEGSMDVWSVVFLRESLGASVLAGAAGFAAFAAATAVGRAFAATVLFGLGHRRTIVASGLGSLAAGTVAVITSSPVVASLAFLVLGFFLSAAAPAAFGIAGDAGMEPGIAIAAVTTLAYTGFVVGPPVMGWLAEAVSLRATMVALVLATAGIVASGARVRKTAPAVLEPAAPAE